MKTVVELDAHVIAGDRVYLEGWPPMMAISSGRVIVAQSDGVLMFCTSARLGPVPMDYVAYVPPHERLLAWLKSKLTVA